MKFFSANKELKPLKELDPLYRDTIAHLSVEIRVNYCRSLVKRCEYDMEDVVPGPQTKSLKNLLFAAKSEVKELEKKHGYRDKFQY